MKTALIFLAGAVIPFAGFALLLRDYRKILRQHAQVTGDLIDLLNGDITLDVLRTRFQDRAIKPK